jgi:hypothetical protein
MMSSAWIQQQLKTTLEEDIAKAKHLGSITGCYCVSLAIFISPLDACFFIIDSICP